MNIQSINRRQFLKYTGTVAAVGALYSVSACDAQSKGASEQPWLFLSVSKERMEFVLPRTEMGQDVATSFVMILSEQMVLPIDRFKVVFANADAQLGQQMTVGSGSIRNWWGRLRVMGAQVRMLVVERAAEQFQCEPSKVEIVGDRVINSTNKDQVVDYLALLEEGWPSLLPPASPLSMNSSQYVGHDTVSLLAEGKVNGRIQFVGDMVSDSSLVAVSVAYRSSSSGLTSEELEVIREQHQVTAVFDLNYLNAGFGCIALVHTDIWSLLKCKAAVEARIKLNAKSAGPEARSFDEEVSRREKLLRDDQAGLELVFKTPSVAHAPMETQSALVEYREGECEVWAPTQAPQYAKAEVAEALGLAGGKVTLHTAAVGGAFGRKRYADYIVEAALISKWLKENQLPSKVCLMWTREDDLGREFYRPASWQLLQWSHGNPKKINYQLLESHSPQSDVVTRRFPALEFWGGDINADRQEWPGRYNSAIWRSVEHGYVAFAFSSFLDELSYVESVDPIEYFQNGMSELSVLDRAKRLLKPGMRYQPDRLKALILAVKQDSGWAKNRVSAKQGVGYGFSAYTCFGSYIAMVAEVEVVENKPKVRRVWAAVDCGIAVNPDGVRAQIEGGIIFGMSACLWGELPEDADSQSLNFHNYPIARMGDVPDIVVNVMKSESAPTGVGELSVPVVAPAIANAIRQAVGLRMLSMPFLAQGRLNVENAASKSKLIPVTEG